MTPAKHTVEYPDNHSSSDGIILHSIGSRLPRRDEILPVFGCVLFVIHTWAIWHFLYNVPSLILSNSIPDVLSVFCYVNGFAFLESLLLLAGLLLTSLILPSSWYKNGFIPNGFITVLVLTISSIQFQAYDLTQFPPRSLLFEHLGFTLAALVGLILLARAVPLAQRILSWVAQNFILMFYIYAPLGLISLLVALARVLV